MWKIIWTVTAPAKRLSDQNTHSTPGKGRGGSGWQPGCRRPRWQMRGQCVSKRSFPLGPARQCILYVQNVGALYVQVALCCVCKTHTYTQRQHILHTYGRTNCAHMDAKQTVHAHCMHRMNTCVCTHTPHRLHVCLASFVITLADTDFYARAFLWTLDPAQCSPQKSFSTHFCVMRCCGHWHKCVHSMPTLCPYSAYNVCA